MRIEAVRWALAALCLSVTPPPAGVSVTPASAGVSVTPASAGEAAAPQSTPTTRAAAAARPAIWVVEDRDTRIFLFGTTHSFERGFAWRSARLERAIAEAGELVVEVAEDQAAHDGAWLETMYLDTPSPIRGRVSSGRHEMLARLIARSGIAEEYWDRTATFPAATILGSLALPEAVPEAERGRAEMSGAEIELIEDFRGRGRPVTALETAAGQIRAFDRFPIEAQRDFLDMTIDAAAVPLEAGGPAGDAAWARGDLRTIERDLQLMTPALREAMVTRRNRAWAAWIAERMERPGSVLFAVGVSHLAGRESVQRMLAARGLRARRID